MAQTEDVLAEYVERLFAKASLLSLAVLGHGRMLEDGCLRPDGNRLDQLQSLATELEFGLGMIHDRLTERERARLSAEHAMMSRVTRALALALALLPLGCARPIEPARAAAVSCRPPRLPAGSGRRPPGRTRRPRPTLPTPEPGPRDLRRPCGAPGRPLRFGRGPRRAGASSPGSTRRLPGSGPTRASS